VPITAVKAESPEFYWNSSAIGDLATTGQILRSTERIYTVSPKNVHLFIFQITLSKINRF